MMNFDRCDSFVEAFERTIDNPVRNSSKVYYTGVDLGTACVVLAVLDENRVPAAGAYRYADVVRDGMVVDYIGAVRIVRELKAEIEEKLGCELLYAAAAIPPGTELTDAGAVKNVVQAAGFEITNITDEPTAANNLLGITDGAVIDIGGGTTGVSIIENGRVTATGDEATGGTHFTLVIAGAYKMSFDDAEAYKKDPKNHAEILPAVQPVMEKVASIIEKITENYCIEQLVLVGGSSCFTGIEKVIERTTGIRTVKPHNPMFVTPLGITLGCTDRIIY